LTALDTGSSCREVQLQDTSATERLVVPDILLATATLASLEPREDLVWDPVQPVQDREALLVLEGVGNQMAVLHCHRSCGPLALLHSRTNNERLAPSYLSTFQCEYLKISFTQ